ncbi:ParA family protein [Cypionkella sp. TWP1-2-1b2]|uniref:ParA family protein n=1 Tax=Cypionkella sp. TWP1-2-1b2 TaxID=2804675 RepID=UPI003CEE2227
MKTIVIAAQKGGAGKTTLARNLAVAASQDGRDVLCLDLDPQGSLRAWWEGRDADAPSTLDRDPAPDVLRATLNAAQAQFDLCIIDTPPAAPEWLTEALGAADLVLIPVRPSPDDLRAVGATIAAVNAARVPFAFALSQPPPAPKSPTKPPAPWRNMAVSRRSISRNGSAMRKPGQRGRVSPKQPTTRQGPRLPLSGTM